MNFVEYFQGEKDLFFFPNCFFNFHRVILQIRTFHLQSFSLFEVGLVGLFVFKSVESKNGLYVDQENTGLLVIFSSNDSQCGSVFL